MRQSLQSEGMGCTQSLTTVFIECIPSIQADKLQSHLRATFQRDHAVVAEDRPHVRQIQNKYRTLAPLLILLDKICLSFITSYLKFTYESLIDRESCVFYTSIE